MAKITRIFTFGAVLAFALISLSQCGVIESDGLIEWSRNTKFFKKLSDQERRAIISLAIAYHDAPESASDPVVFPTNPTKPRAEEIPATLFTSMMNGKVPNQWMKKFIGWLRNNLKITNDSFNLYRHDFTDVLCTANNATCYSVRDVGQNCCPFG